jgi:hypothetical protein
MSRNNSQMTPDEVLAQLREEISEGGLGTGGESFLANSTILAVEVAPLVSWVVDDLMASDQPASLEMRNRILSYVDSALRVRRTRSGLLETLLRYSREERHIEIEVIAGQMKVDPEILEGLESGTVALAEVDELAVAQWISFLEGDNGDAVEALRRSVFSASPGAYLGRSDDSSRTAEEYVRRVLVHLKTLNSAD